MSKKNALSVIYILIIIVLCVIFYRNNEILYKPNTPVLIDGMIEVMYNGDTWVKADKDNLDNNYKWYDYDNQNWANVVLIKDSDRYENIQIGEKISNEDILAFYVWIPRYKYRVFNINKQKGYEYYNALENGIDIVFEEGTNSTGTVKCRYYFNKKLFSKNNEVCVGNNGDYYTHPAFTFGDTELSGIWVGKFETTGTSDSPTILPNEEALSNLNIFNQFNTSKKFALYLKEKVDSHMARNMEWGAVAYLAHSKYGKCMDGCSEISANNNEDWITGTLITENIYNTYNSDIGVYGSTTGNIYGVYDMNGGVVENVMANISKKKNKYIFNGDFYSGFSLTWYNYNNKYIDKYAYNEEVITDSSVSNCYLGDAMGETRGWHDDSNWAPTVDTPWIERGGNYSMEKNSGIFAYGGNMGYNINMNGFRSVIVSR